MRDNNCFDLFISLEKGRDFKSKCDITSINSIFSFLDCRPKSPAVYVNCILSYTVCLMVLILHVCSFRVELCSNENLDLRKKLDSMETANR